MQANKNGYFYVLDRVNGEYISAGEMSQMSWARGIDSKGRPMVNPEAYLHIGKRRYGLSRPDAQHVADVVQPADGIDLRSDQPFELL